MGERCHRRPEAPPRELSDTEACCLSLGEISDPFGSADQSRQQGKEAKTVKSDGLAGR